MRTCEITKISRTGTGYAVNCVEWVVDEHGNNVPVTGSSYPEHVNEAAAGGLSATEQATVDAAIAILERHASANFEAKKGAPAELHKLVADAKQAQTDLEVARLESQRIELENVAKIAELAALNEALEAARAKAAAPVEPPQRSAAPSVEIVELSK